MTIVSGRTDGRPPSLLILVVVVGLAACAGERGALSVAPLDAGVDQRLTGDAALPLGCLMPCADSRDCASGLHCVALHWFDFNRGCYDDNPRSAVCIRGDCPGYWQSCINDTAWSEDGCISEKVAPVPYNEPNHVHYGDELVYCPNGCVDSCSSGGCDGGARGTNARCK